MIRWMFLSGTPCKTTLTATIWPHLICDVGLDINKAALRVCTDPGISRLESPEIKMLRFPGLESPGKRHRSWKSPGMPK